MKYVQINYSSIVVFFTNLNSAKGKDFKNNNNLSMCFYWESIKKQIRITGKAYKIEVFAKVR